MPKIVHVTLLRRYRGSKHYVIIGEVLEENGRYIKLKCRTFHFGRLSFGMGGVHQGGLEVRGIPYSSIHTIKDLPEDTNWKVKPVYSDSDDLVILDNEHKTLIVDARITRFEGEDDTGPTLGGPGGIGGGSTGGTIGGALPDGHVSSPSIGG